MIKNELKFERENNKNIDAYARRMNDEITSERVGYYHLPNLDESIVKKLSDLKREFTDKKHIILVGVGGSSLGVKALYELLCDGDQMIFLDNLDPFYIEKSLEFIDLNSSVFVISSKSGTTIETIGIYKYLLAKFRPSNLDNFIFITDPQSPLESYAKENNAKFFDMPKNVGGRFSVLSTIGLVPLSLCNVDISALLDGARACKSEFIDNADDTILQKAYHYAVHPNAKINVLFSYCSRFKSFGEWYVQLWAESLGKKRGYKRVGQTPASLIGSKDQHSFLQLIMDGIKDKTITFMILKDHGSDAIIPRLDLKYLEKADFADGFKIGDVLNSQALATAQALCSENISVDLIEIDKLDAWHAGWLIYYFELLTSAMGLMLGVNTYDQPGVELGKRILKDMLANKK